MLIKPTIGRIVWYFKDRNQQENDQAYPARVCYVHGDRMINVACDDNNGDPFKATSVTLVQDDTEPPAIGPFAMWMPYQSAQAAKAEKELQDPPSI